MGKPSGQERLSNFELQTSTLLLAPSTASAAGGRAIRELHDSSRLHVVPVARAEDEVGLFPRLIQPRVVVDGDLPLAHHLELIALDDDRGALGETDAEELGILPDDGDQIVPAIARV